MRFFGPLSLAIVASAAFLSATPSRAAVVSISHDKLEQCGRDPFVFCSGRQAYSLSEIESGAIQIPVFPVLPSEVVIVNDTGHAVNTLQLSFSTIQLFAFDVQCLIQPSAQNYFSSCNVADNSKGFTGFPGLFNQVTADFTFKAGNDAGIPDGAYFDVVTVGFLPGGFLCGGGSGNGGTGTGGTGTGGTGTGGTGTGGTGTGGTGSGGTGSGGTGGTGNPGPPSQ